MRSHFLRASYRPVFIGVAQIQEGSSVTSTTINTPTSTVSGDLLIAILTSTSGTATWTTATDWTEVLDTNGRSIQYRTAPASPPANTTFTSSTASTLQGYIICYRYAAYDTISTLDTLPVSITLSSNNSVIIGYGSRQTATGITFTAPADFRNIASDSDGTAPSSAVFEKIVNAGSSGSISFTASTGTATNLLIGIKPG